MQRVAVLATLTTTPLAQANSGELMDVYRDPNCGCCSKWIAYLRDHGFTVNDHLEANMSSLKAKLGVPEKLMSCHTGVVNGKFVEGHVPVEQINELAKRNDLTGVSAPGMPIGSPGMEYGNRRNAYQIVGVKQNGEEVVVSEYPAQ